MPLPLAAKADILFISLSCFLIALLLVIDPSLIVDSTLPQLVSRLTGLPTASVIPGARDAYAFGAFGYCNIGLTYALAVWMDNELFMRCVVFVRLGVSVFGSVVVLTTGFGGATLLTAAMADLAMAGLGAMLQSCEGEHGKRVVKMT